MHMNSKVIDVIKHPRKILIKLEHITNGKYRAPDKLVIKEQFKNTVDLSVEDTRVIKYLKGETIDIKDLDTKTKGWILICVNGYPLGFGKIDKGIIKNKYAKGWRWQ